ncbi:MAG: hypothetical protein ACI8UO_006743 [Verrucomicrobiales bacterium]|jgi:hypothetical protein
MSLNLKAVIPIALFLTAGFGISAPPDYAEEIKPLLKNRCWNCHGSLKQKAGLRLDAGSLIHAGADGASILEMSAPAESELIFRLTTDDPDERMPPEGTPLSAKQVELLKAWIAAGAPYPEDEIIPAKPEEHWAFQAVARPEIPAVKSADWPRNEIDHFILAKLEARGWTPNPDATPQQLLRRAHLDLIGLPPTLEEQDGFKISAWAALIDDLLSRPAYGERYARHWLDVVRYADSNGYERDRAKPEVWRYRDYVIGALNADRPFDRFIVEQLAGDEIPDATAETVLATGFNRLGPWDDEPADFAVDRFDQLDDIVNTTSQAFLGLTMGCARCHDHKFDPLTQIDYYSMVAVFDPLKRPQAGRTELTRYAAPPEVRAKLVARDKAIEVEQKAKDKLRGDFAMKFLKDDGGDLSAEVRAVFQKEAKQRNADEKKLAEKSLAAMEAEVEKALPAKIKRKVKQHEERIAELQAATPEKIEQGYFFEEEPGFDRLTKLLNRGSPENPGDAVTPAVPAVLVSAQPNFPDPDKHTTKRRLTLASWIASDDNPLTARVIVNRVWQWHFGEALVRTPNDFGLIGERPTDQQLLDWLAHWFVHDADWSLKKLHRKIMTSRAYQMSRSTNPEYAAEDPENFHLWRMPLRRLEVEAIRDSMLFVSGRLDRKMHGPAMHPFVPRDALLNHADKESIWPKFDENAASRRTVYAFIKRSLLVPMLEVLDLCDTTQTSPKRAVTTVPTQALTLFNGDFAVRQSKHFADRLRAEAGDDLETQIELAYRLALSRNPSIDEMTAMRTFRNEQPLEEMCRVIFNLNEFVYPD